MAELEKKPIEPKVEETGDEAPVGKANRYGLNITNAFADDLADFVGTKVSMIKMILKEGLVRDDTMKIFLDAHPKYKK